MKSTTADKISVVLLDDHPMILLATEIAIAKQQDMQVTGSFNDSRELLFFLQQQHADVLVLDYILGSEELDGLSLIKQILAHHAELSILLYSSMENVAVIRAAFQHGIKGYLSKRERAHIYVHAIRVLSRGQRYIPDEIEMELTKISSRKQELAEWGRPVSSFNSTERDRLETLLSPREAEVIRCVLDGMRNHEIANKLKRSRKTISGHKQAGMKKLGINSDLELFKYHAELFR